MSSARGREALTYIAANVRKARVRIGLTQERLAELADLDLRFVQRVERGTANPSALTIVALADALKVRPGSLFNKAKLPKVRRGRPPGRGARTA